MADYGGEVIAGRAVAASPTSDGLEVELDTGDRVPGRRLLVATGITDELPDVAGLPARWGRDVLHCPYCHGWEFRDQPIGVLATGPQAAHQALLFRQWTSDLTLLRHTGPAPTDEEAERLSARGVTLVPGEVASVETGDDDRLRGVRLRSGELVELRALAVAPRAVPHAAVLTTLGLEPSPHPSGTGDHIAADASGLTGVPGVWAAGNLTDPRATVLASAASGAAAAGAINADLTTEDTNRALRAARGALAHGTEN
ncbi:NAD(P)/FAD-dependent oxidoreductase [Haloactinospora alba]|uniref:NAD(P)/FAD-dependent oxidoreductase n=1 Tax=Haloactinospora alba TaxID=405555 RepID=UPI00319DD3ED